MYAARRPVKTVTDNARVIRRTPPAVPERAGNFPRGLAEANEGSLGVGASHAE